MRRNQNKNMSLIPTAYAQATSVAASTTSAAGSSLDFASLAWKIFLAANVLIITVVLGSLASKWVRRKIVGLHGDQHQELALLYSRITFLVVAAVGATIGLSAAGIPLQWFSGAIGLGLGLALQGPVSSFIAGIVLLSNDKFNIGDFVVIGENRGTIVDIQSRVTTLRGIDGAQISIPNTDMLSSQVVCYTRNPVRRAEVQIGVGYGTNLAEVTALIEQIVRSHTGVEPTPEPVVLVSSVAESAVVLEARFWVESHSKWWKVKSELTHQIFDALQNAGVDIPYPVRTLRVDADSSAELAGKPAKKLRQNLTMSEQSTKTETSQPATEAPKSGNAPANSTPVGAAFAGIPQEEA